MTTEVQSTAQRHKIHTPTLNGFANATMACPRLSCLWGSIGDSRPGTMNGQLRHLERREALGVDLAA